MKLRIILLTIAAGTIWAQQKETITITRSVAGVGPVGIEQMMGGSIKGQPYSADVINEMAQTLADGNRIVNSQKGFVARDSMGRTRNDSAVQIMGMSGGNNEPLKISMIHDPVAQVTYTLESNSKIARRVSTATGGDSPMLRAKIEAESHAIVAGGNVMFGTRTTAGQVKTESLGTQVIEGVMADGTRTIETIPAGQIGNEKDILITNEVWVAQELKAVVLSKRVDPRMGEMTYKLTNIQRAEPAASTFEVPAGSYKIVDGPSGDVFMYKHQD